MAKLCHAPKNWLLPDVGCATVMAGNRAPSRLLAEVALEFCQLTVECL